ncbi:MAG: NADH-quinone oxidoreductase subunit L [Actinomycetota bacterium]
MTEHAYLIPILPLAAFFLIIAFGKRLPLKGPEIGIVAVSISFIMSVGIIAKFVGAHGAEHAREISTRWFPFGSGAHLQIGMKIDGLTAVMFIVVTTVSLLVQIYSIGYMKGEVRYTWFFAALSLFTGSMLTLVIANNLLMMLIGWELVGICSYLLIGHYWEEKANSNAAIKAFITTKTGDVPFLIGIFVLFAGTHTFNINAIYHKVAAGDVSHATLTAAAILLFGGAIGKSGQFPLHVWLPDAMAGPTPVSALIHAATMVTAGVFLVARLFPVFAASPEALNEVALIGAFTMLFAALIAMVQDDIKRVLAYSTVSQLAYMMAALGVGAREAAVFHLFTHAFFKALLFLGAGSVIHAAHSNSMRDMGGLRKLMPTTYATFLIATLALSGIPPFAGFWSKDEILTEAFRAGQHGPTHIVGYIVYVFGAITAFLTAFYMMRAFQMTFMGKYRGEAHPHESPRVMTGPLVILGALSVVAGFVGIPGLKSGFGSWLALGEHEVESANYLLIVVSVLLAGGGLVLGSRVYRTYAEVDPLERLGWFHKVLVNKFYIDEFYMAAIVRPIRDRVSRATLWINQNVLDGAVNGAAAVAKISGDGLYDQLDQKVVDGAINGIGITARATGGVLKYLQSGDVQKYAAYLFAGIVILAVLFTRFA